ncbi:hypothetical protein Lser_V15G39963 [Lactuca serriola]
MSFSAYAPPPTALSGALRILKPDFPEGQTTVAGDYPSEAHAPSFSTGLLNSSQLQHQIGDQRAVTVSADVVDLSPPEETDLRAFGHSIVTSLTGNNNRVLDENYASGASYSDLLHQRNSGYDLANHFSNGEGPRISQINQRPHSIIGSSIDNTPFDPLANAMNTLTGINLRNAYNQYKQFDDLDDDDDDDLPTWS